MKNSKFYIGMTKLETLSKGNELLYRRPLMMVIIYPYDLPDKYKPKRSDVEPFGKLNREYLEYFVRKYAEIGDITDGWGAYAMYHYDERITEYDVEKEKSLIYAVYMAYKNDAPNLRTYIIKSNKTYLASDHVRNNALNMTFEQFYNEYGYYNDNKIGESKKPHIHIVFYYYNASNKFKTYTIMDNFKTEFYNSSFDCFNGMLFPVALYGSIDELVRYLPHTDIERKKHYDFRDIVAVNCNDAAERYTDGAPSTKKSDLSRKFYRIAIDNECYTYNSLLEVLKKCNRFLYEIAGTRTGRQLAEGAAKDAYQEKKRTNDRKVAEEIRKSRSDDLEVKEKSTKVLDDIAGSLRDKNKKS